MWKQYKEGDKKYLSIVYKHHAGHYGGYYVTMFLEEGDYYIPLYELGDPMKVGKPQETTEDVIEVVKRHLIAGEHNLDVTAESDYIFWDGFTDCAKSILQEIEETKQIKKNDA